MPLVLALFAVASCHHHEPKPDTRTLRQLRHGFQTYIMRRIHGHSPPPTPPAGVLRLVHYPSPVGRLAAYISPRPKNGGRRPAVLWIVGGFDNGIDDFAWTGTRENDQSAQAFREAGLVLMLPSLRGGNDNPGVRESFYGEVDDVLAAADYLAKVPYVDPTRIYLGGHSTGGTLALLVDESTTRFRAVLDFGPVARAEWYGQRNLVYDVGDKREDDLRSPVVALRSITTPTFVFSGALQPSNVEDLKPLEDARGMAPVSISAVPNANHWTMLYPVTEMLAKKIAGLRKDDRLQVTKADVAAAMGGIDAKH